MGTVHPFITGNDKPTDRLPPGHVITPGPIRSGQERELLYVAVAGLW